MKAIGKFAYKKPCSDCYIHRKAKAFFVFVLLAIPFLQAIGRANEPQIQKLVIIGNERTRESYLRHFIESTEGSPYDTATIEEDQRRLKNLTSILDTKWYSLPNGNEYTLIYIITERFTILPVGDFGIAKGNYYFGFGAMETNALGRGIYLYGFYRYNQQHSFHGIVRWPYIGRSNWGLELQGQHWNNEEPFYAFEQKVSYEKKLTHLYAAARYAFTFEHDISMGISYRNERFNYIDTSQAIIWVPEQQFTLLGIRFEYNRQHISHNRFRLDGWDNQLVIYLQHELANKQNFLTVYNSIKLFKTFGKRGNLAVRNILGVSSPRFDPFSTFTLDNFDNIRGIGYQAKRGNAILCFNAEYRTTIYSNELIALQFNLFADAGSVRAYRWETSKWLSPNQFELYVGPGLKLLALQAHGATISLDFGLKTTDIRNNGFVLTVGQYF